MSAKLLPCPFCGSKGILHEGRVGYLVVCQNTSGEPCNIGNTHNDWTEDAAIEMWNRRAGVRVDYIEPGVFQGSEEDVSLAGIDYGEEVAVIKLEPLEEEEEDKCPA